MIKNIESSYKDISLIKTIDVNKINELFMSNNCDIKYDYFNFYINNTDNGADIFIIKHNSETIGAISLYNIDTINKNANIYGFVIEKSYYSYLLKSLICLFKYAFAELKLNKLSFFYIEENYFFDDICRHLKLTNEGILRNQLYNDGKYSNILSYSILLYEFQKIFSNYFRKIYTWDYTFKPDKFVQLDINKFMNNRAFTSDINNINNANLNDLREFVLNKKNTIKNYLSYHNIKFHVKIFDEIQKYDNLVCKKQEIKIDENYYSDILFIAMAQFGYQKSNLTLIYENNNSKIVEFNVSDWCERILYDEHILHHAWGCRNLSESINIIKGDSFIYLKRIKINKKNKLQSFIMPDNKNINIFAIGICKA